MMLNQQTICRNADSYKWYSHEHDAFTKFIWITHNCYDHVKHEVMNTTKVSSRKVVALFYSFICRCVPIYWVLQLIHKSKNEYWTWNGPWRLTSECKWNECSCSISNGSLVLSIRPTLISFRLYAEIETMRVFWDRCRYHRIEWKKNLQIQSIDNHRN